MVAQSGRSRPIAPRAGARCATAMLRRSASISSASFFPLPQEWCMGARRFQETSKFVPAIRAVGLNLTNYVSR